jgi:tripartite-type tricarboxylate transporter receptor subunit TctC
MKRLLALLFFVPILSFAWQPEPNKNITVLVPNPPGSGNELAFRTLASIINKTDTGPKFVVETRPGADGAVALNAMKTAPNDGYHIIAVPQGGLFLTNDLWEKNVKKYNWDDFTYTLTYGKSPLVLVAGAKSSVNTPQDFVRLISTTKKPVSVATGGGAHRTAFEYLMHHGKGNAELVKTVKFQGPLQVLTSVAQFDGSIGTEFGILPIAIARPMIEAGKVKPIGFTGNKKLAMYPSVPLLNSVSPGNNATAAWNIALPPNTPKEIVNWYVAKFSAAMKTPEYQTWMNENGVYIDEKEMTPEGVHEAARTWRRTYMPIMSKIDLTKD